VGGQLVAGPDMKALLGSIKTGTLKSWDAIHAAQDKLWARYPREKQAHAMASLVGLLGVDRLGVDEWREALDEAGRIQDGMSKRVASTRAKDYENPFRIAAFADSNEMEAVVGDVADNSFVKQMRQETRAFKKRLVAADGRG